MSFRSSSSLSAGPNAAVLAARLSGRPLLMTEAGARDYAVALMRQAGAPAPVQGGLSALLGWVKGAKAGQRAGAGRAKSEAEAAEGAPPVYAAHWMPPCEAEGFGWSLVDGVAIVRIDGPLLDQGFHSEWSGWIHGYDTLSATFADIAADARVKGVWLRLKSPGGMGSNGLPELVAQLRALDKPVWAWCEYAYSAAYWIASACDRIVGGQLSGVGSIGAVSTWCGMAGALEQEGFEVVHVQFGAKKTDGSPFKALSDTALADWQADIDQLGGLFVDGVVAGRPNLTRDQVIATQAGCYLLEHADKARDAVAVGLADAVLPERDCFFAFADAVSAQSPDSHPAQEPEMKRSTALAAASKIKLSAAQMSAFAAALTEAEAAEETPAEGEGDGEGDEEDAAPAETAEDAAPAEGEGEGDGEGEDDGEGDDETPPAEASAATAKAVLNLPEAKGRDKLARELAFEPGMTVETAKRLLSASPKGGSLTDRMQGRDPNVTHGGGAAPAAANIDPKAIYGRRSARTSRGRKSA